MGGPGMSHIPGLTDSPAYLDLFEFVSMGGVRPITRLREAGRLRAAAEELTLRLIEDARKEGATWEAIGAALGVTKQAASQLHKRARRSGGVAGLRARKGRADRVG